LVIEQVVFNGCCSETEVSEQLYIKERITQTQFSSKGKKTATLVAVFFNLTGAEPSRPVSERF
jgi:hypothetical protein